MYKRILSLSFLFFSISGNYIFANKSLNKINENKTDDFINEFLDDETNYKINPQKYFSFYPKYGINFISINKDEDKKDFSIFGSRNAGATLAINIPIKSFKFFYSVACDFSHRTLKWNNYKNFYNRSLYFAQNKDTEKLEKDYLENLKKDVKFSNLNFFDLNFMLQFGFKNNVLDHRNGFFSKIMLGVGFRFSENVDIKKEDFTLRTNVDNFIPIRNIKFLWGLEVGYWRVGLNFTGDFSSLFKKAEQDDKNLDVSRGIIPFALNIFFDLF